MPTEAEIVDQLAGYCEWLEGELGAPMHRSRVITITGAGRTPQIERPARTTFPTKNRLPQP